MSRCPERLRLLLIVLALLPGFTVAAFAATTAQPAEDEVVRMYDRVFVKDRENPWEGQIIEETPLAISIRNRQGITLQLLKENIARIVRRNPPERAYQVRSRRVDARDAQANLELAQWCLSDSEWGLWKQARDHLETAIRVAPTTREAYDLILPLYDREDEAAKTLERRDAEIGVFWRGLEAGIRDPQFALRSARHLEIMGDRAGAIDLYEQLLELEPEADLRKRTEANIARLLEESGERERAQEFVESLNGTSAADLDLLRARWALESVAAGDPDAWERLRTTVERLLESDAHRQEAHLLLGCAQLDREEFDAAAKSFQKALSGIPTAELSLSAALFFARVGDQPKATALLGTVHNVVAENPELGELERQITAYLLENEGKPEEALEALQAALHDGATWQTWVVYMQAMARLRDGVDVEAMAGEILSRFGQNPVAFAECALFLGDHFYRKDLGAKSRRWLEYAREVLGDDPEVLLRLGVAHLLEGGSLARARMLLEQAHDAIPQNPDLRNGMGCVAYREEQFVDAERWFRSVIDLLVDDDTARNPKVADAPPAVAYARRALRQLDGVLGEELWVDDFARQTDDGQVLNNWVADATVGVDVELEGEAAVLSGRQKTPGLTLLSRKLTDARLSRYRASIRIARGADAVEVALRLEHETGIPGLVFFRAPDGVLGFVLNQDQAVRSDAEFAEGSAEAKYELVPTRWPDDGQAHQLEIRLDPEHGSDYELYFDGQRVAHRIRMGRVRGELLAGISGRAEAGVEYRIEVERFEMYRRKLKVENRERR